MVACIFRICAAAATPWAWLPDENATTPPPRFSGGIDDSLLKAPRNLNDPVRCSSSGFRNTFAPRRSLSTGGDNSGVRTAYGAITFAAASISDEVTGRFCDWDMAAFYRVDLCTGKVRGANQVTKRGCLGSNGTAESSGPTSRISAI